MLSDLISPLPAAGTVAAPPRWAGTPACASVEPELFFPLEEDGPPGEAAKAVCAGCALRARCLAYALSAGMAAGVWGGMSTTERDALIRTQRVTRRGA